MEIGLNLLKMAGAVCRQQTPVQLGYVDEKITAKYAAQVDFSTSKIGGQAVRNFKRSTVLKQKNE